MKEDFKDKSLDDLRKQRRLVSDEIKRREAADKTAYYQELVGQCYTSTASYGGPDPWTIYTRVLEAKDAKVRVSRFQRDSNGIVTIEPSVWLENWTPGVESTEGMFWSQWGLLLTDIHDSMTTVREPLP